MGLSPCIFKKNYANGCFRYANGYTNRMSLPPFCETCQSRHHPHQAHVFSSSPAERPGPDRDEGDLESDGISESGSPKPAGDSDESCADARAEGGAFPAVGPEGCLECGATAQTFADAEKWSKVRENQRRRMRRRRRDG